MIVDFQKDKKRKIIVDLYKSNRVEVEYAPYGDDYYLNLEILEVGINNVIVDYCGQTSFIPLEEVKNVFVKETNKK